jgi:hypothetical protein
MMDMENLKLQTGAGLQLPEHLEKAHRICPSGHGNQYAAAFFEHIIGGHVVVNSINHVCFPDPSISSRRGTDE